jgi:ABC-2 type transport system ATP-binding protein
MLLDEPTSGLDPYAQRLLLDLIIQAAADGCTILLSSHQIGQIERAAEAVAILDRGRIVVQGDVDDLFTMNKVIEAVFAQPPAIALLQSNPNLSLIEECGPLVRLRARGDIDAIGRDLQNLGAQSVRSIDQSLEDIFLAAVSPSASEVF